MLNNLKVICLLPTLGHVPVTIKELESAVNEQNQGFGAVSALFRPHIFLSVPNNDSPFSASILKILTISPHRYLTLQSTVLPVIMTRAKKRKIKKKCSQDPPGITAGRSASAYSINPDACPRQVKNV
jgi:hypothetical protein